MRLVLAIFAFEFLMMSTCLAQQGSLPNIQCGNQAFPAYPRVVVRVQPIALIDSLQLPIKVDGMVLGSSSYPVWEFRVLDRYEGFCSNTICIAVDHGLDSLLAMDELMLQYGTMYGASFALISQVDAYPINEQKHIRGVHGSQSSRIGKVLQVQRRSSHFTLEDIGIELLLPDSANYGYDTAIIKDVIFEVTFQSAQDTFVAFTRDSVIRETPMFQAGERYLMRLLANRNESWILSDHLYKEGYHVDAYFKAYESLR